MRPAIGLMFSFATRYAPPPVGYAWIVWRYEKATTASSAVMTRLMGMAYTSAAVPATISVATMKSVAYATDDSASDESTARPVTRDSRS